MEVHYGTENKKGRIVFDIGHKFGRGLSQSDQMTMVMRAVIKKHPDAGNFQFFTRIKTGELCAGHFNRIEV